MTNQVFGAVVALVGVFVGGLLSFVGVWYQERRATRREQLARRIEYLHARRAYLLESVPDTLRPGEDDPAWPRGDTREQFNLRRYAEWFSGVGDELENIA